MNLWRGGGAWLFALLVGYAAPCLSATLLRDVRLIDGSGRPPAEHTDLLFDGTTITAIGPHGSLGIAPGTTIVECTGMSVVPGLISDHSHLGQVDGTTAQSGNMTRANIVRQLAQYEAYGITTVMSLGLNMQVFYQLQPAVHQGSLPGADMFGADRGFGAVHGAPPGQMGISDQQVYRPPSPDAARAQVRESIQRQPTLLKLWLDDFHGSEPEKIEPAIYEAIIDEAHRHHYRVAAHVYYLDDAKKLVAAGIDVLAHGVRDKPVDAEFTTTLKQREVWYIPTLDLDESFYLFAQQPQLLQQPLLAHGLQPALATQLADPAWRRQTLSDANKIAVDKQARAVNLQNLKTLYDAGIKIGFGTDSGATPLRVAGFAEHRELTLLVEAGLTPLQAITLATQNAAALLNLDDRGLLAPGKLADLVLIRGNPATRIADLDSIQRVWRRGQPAPHVIDDFTP
jgi:imidazolonepropionase-like amidohydrolase